MSAKATPSGMDFLEETADFVLRVAAARLTPPFHVRAPDPFSVDHILSCYRAGDVFVEAMARYVTMPWSLSEVLTQAHSRKRGFAGRLPEDIRATLGPGTAEGAVLPIIDYPCHVQDKDGRVLLVYLPGFLRREQEEQLSHAVGELGKATECQLTTKKDGHWRAHEQYFNQSARKGMIPVGVASYSPCWFTMGRPAPAFQPKPSGTIRRLNGADGGLPFVKGTKEVFALIGATLSILNPAQYSVGLQAWRQLANNAQTQAAKGFEELTAEVLKSWASPFTVAQVIGNRESPLHCDTKGFVGWYDALLTFREHERVHLDTPGLNTRWVYQPGTAVFLLSNAIEHGVGKVEGERGCIASFMRPEVVVHLLKKAQDYNSPVPTSDDVRRGIAAARRKMGSEVAK